MVEGSIYSTFEKDTKNFIDEINESLIKLENNGYSVELINHIFRCIHSIKSEAAYLDLQDITSAAHDMESVIEPLRNVGEHVEVDKALIEFCYSTIDRIGEMSVKEPETSDMDDYQENGLEELDEPDDVEGHGSGDYSPVPEETGLQDNNEAGKPYTDFEIMLLREARSRGEKLFRVSFSVAEEEPMKYPRAYLALSNLEQELNVIKIEPPVENLTDYSDGEIEVVLSTRKLRQDIMERLSIDQIVNIRVDELFYEQELRNEAGTSKGSGEMPIVSHERIISVEAGEIDAISEYVSEIKNRLNDLSSVFNETGADNKLEHDLAGLESISDSIERMMSNLKTVDFNKHFAGYKRTVRDLAQKLGKKAELFFDERNSRVQRDFADFIAEPMLQLIRNAVVHGIEEPELRSEAGKPEVGTISIKLLSDENQISIKVEDDGKGIDTAAFPDKFGGISGDEQLLELLVQPGFTTKIESEDYAGRGVGLDLVSSKIRKRGGLLEMENLPGRSFSLAMVFPDNNGKN